MRVGNAFAFAEEGQRFDEKFLDFGRGEVLEIGSGALCFVLAKVVNGNGMLDGAANGEKRGWVSVCGECVVATW